MAHKWLLKVTSLTIQSLPSVLALFVCKVPIQTLQKFIIHSLKSQIPLIQKQTNYYYFGWWREMSTSMTPKSNLLETLTTGFFVEFLRLKSFLKTPCICGFQDC